MRCRLIAAAEKKRCYNNHMKNSEEVIRHLYFSNSQKLRQIRCTNTLKALLPPRLAGAISYIYSKNQKLYIVIDQFGLKMEFNYKRELIKSLLNSIHNQTALCEDLKDLEIVISVSVKHHQAETGTQAEFHYPERASGTFENLAQDPVIRELVEKIRANIQTNAAKTTG